MAAWSDSDLEMASDMEQNGPIGRNRSASRRMVKLEPVFDSDQDMAAIASPCTSDSGRRERRTSPGGADISSESLRRSRPMSAPAFLLQGPLPSIPKRNSSTKEKYGPNAKGLPLYNPQSVAGSAQNGGNMFSVMLMTVGVIVGLFGTFAMLMACGILVPPHAAGAPGYGGPQHNAMPSGTPAENVRVIHLSLAGSDRKVRYGVSPHTRWDDFLHGIQERLQLPQPPKRLETSDGVAIHSEVDLQHRDNLVVYEAEPEQSAAIEAWTTADVVSFFGDLNLSQCALATAAGSCSACLLAMPCAI